MTISRNRYEVYAVWGQSDNETRSLVETAINRPDAFTAGEKLFHRETLYHSGMGTLVPRIQVSYRISRRGKPRVWEYVAPDIWRDLSVGRPRLRSTAPR